MRVLNFIQKAMKYFLSKFIFTTGRKFPQHVRTVLKTMSSKPNWNLEAAPQ